MDLNKNLLIYLNSLLENKIIEKLVLIFVDTPIFFIPLFLIGMWIYYKIKKLDKKNKLLYIFYSTIIGILITFIIKKVFFFERPETVINGVGKLILTHIPNASFPSDHATVSFSFLTGLFLANYKKTFWYFLPFVIIMNISRIIAGVHWPLDILVGSIIGIISAFISFKVLKKYKFIKKLNKFIIKVIGFLKL